MSYYGHYRNQPGWGTAGVSIANSACRVFAINSHLPHYSIKQPLPQDPSSCHSQAGGEDISIALKQQEFQGNSTKSKPLNHKVVGDSLTLNHTVGYSSTRGEMENHVSGGRLCYQKLGNGIGGSMVES